MVLHLSNGFDPVMRIYNLDRNDLGRLTQVPGADGLIGVARSGYTVCAFSDEGDVGCFGDLRAYRPLRFINSNRPGAQVACNRDHPCTDRDRPVCTQPDAEGSNGGLCIGCRDDADCGPGTCFDYYCYQAEDARLLRQCESSPFTIMAGLSDVVELVADQSSFAARTSLGEIYRWGRFVIRQEGDSVVRRRRRVTKVEMLAPATQLAANANTMCALLDDGRVSCWGLYNGQEHADPAIIQGLPPAIELSRSTRLADHFCARIRPGVPAESEFYCWGRNDWFQLGDGTQERREEAVPVTVSYDDRPRRLP